MTSAESELLTAPLRHPTYRRLFLAQVIALLGTGLTTVALALLAYDLAGGKAGAVLGTALAIKMVAYVGVAPLLGAVAYRLPRRRLLVALDLARAACVACLPWVSEIWHVYVLVFVLNACSAGFTPIFQATIPDLLKDEATYTRALSLSRLAYDLENLLSPTLAALALLVVSYSGLFAANALAFCLSAALVLSVTLPAARPVDSAQGALHETFSGVRAYLKTPRLQGLLALSLAAAASGAMVIVNTVVYVSGRLGGSEADTAVALAATGAGSMVAALSLPKLLDRYADRGFMLAGGVLAAVGLVLGVSGPGYGELLGLWLLLGLAGSLVQTPAGRLLVRASHASDRPAFFAAQFALSHLCWLVTYPLAGWMGVAFGLEAAFGVLGALALVAALCAWRLWPARDEQHIEHVHDATDHEHVHVHDEHHQHEHEGWEGAEPHAHPHHHAPLTHTHVYVIDSHHARWPGR